MKHPHGGRILVLDGMRGFGMCMVLVQHFFYTREGVVSAFDRTVFGLVDSGWWAMDSFFVLSAFLITGILCDTQSNKRYFLDFYARRTLRIFPLYYAALFLFFVVLPRVPHPLVAEYVSDSSPDQAWFWTYMTNFRIASMGDWYDHLVPSAFWSLAVEEHFYLLWPVFVLYFSRRTFVRFCWALFVVAFGVRVALAVAGANPVATFVLTPARMDCLAVGALLAVLRRDELAFERTARAASRAIPVLVLFLVLLTLPHAKLDWKDPLTNTVGFSVTALMCGGILVRAVHAPPHAMIRRVLENRTLRMIGKYSYAMYIFHGPAASLTKQLYDFDRAPLVMGSVIPLTVVYALLASLVTLGAGWLSWNLVERHFLGLQGRFGGAGRDVPGSSATPAGGLRPVRLGGNG